MREGRADGQNHKGGGASEQVACQVVARNQSAHQLNGDDAMLSCRCLCRRVVASCIPAASCAIFFFSAATFPPPPPQPTDKEGSGGAAVAVEAPSAPPPYAAVEGTSRPDRTRLRASRSRTCLCRPSSAARVRSVNASAAHRTGTGRKSLVCARVPARQRRGVHRSSRRGLQQRGRGSSTPLFNTGERAGGLLLLVRADAGRQEKGKIAAKRR